MSRQAIYEKKFKVDRKFNRLINNYEKRLILDLCRYLCFIGQLELIVQSIYITSAPIGARECNFLLF